MNETAEDLAGLQELLDRSYDAAGAHLKRIITPERRLSAERVSERLQGMCLLSLATATRDGRPIVGPVDGIFFRGAFHFGSAPDSVRFQHIHQRPQVSATHLPGEELAVTVHGRAELIDIRTDAFRQVLLDVYRPLYGAEYETNVVNSGAQYARIEADRMFTFHMPAGG